MLRIGVVMYQTSLTKGQELVAQRMVREFRRQGHEAFLITSIFHDGEPAIGADEVKGRGGFVHLFDRSLGIPVIRLNSGGASWPPRRIAFEDFLGILTKIVEELDLNVLITHSTLWNGPEEVVKFVTWRRRMVAGGAPYHPLVFCHMSHFQEASDERYAIYERSYRETWNSTVLPRIMHEADIVLVTTPLEGEFMKRFGASEEKLVLFPGGVEEEDIISLGDAALFRAQHSLEGGAKLVSYLGTVEERKNPLALLEVAKKLSARRDIRFIIAGKLEGEYGARVKEEATKLANVSVLGPVSEREKAGLIRASHLNITMSRSEALGISQLEFMVAGVPVITSGVGGQSWVVRDGVNGVVLQGPDDVEGAAAAVVRLSSKSQRDRLGRNAARFASGFTTTSLVDRLSRLLEGELRRRPEGVDLSQGAQGEEKVIEAWVHDGEKVAATSKRLIIRSARTGMRAIEIPYNEIVKITRYVKAPWPILVVGAVVTLVLVSQRVLGLGLIERFLAPDISALLSMVGIPQASAVLVAVLPFLPLFVSVAAFFMMLTEGFLVQYGRAGNKVFLSKRFAKALRLADRMTPNDLFADESR